jgi:hypothetical protein
VGVERLTYFLITRKLFDSAIWRDNLHVLKLFIYLIGSARHQDKPKVFNNFKVCRGELVTSLSDIADDNEFLERNRVKKWSRAKVSRMLRYLEDKKYIKILADTYGTHISICNYDFYQTQKNYLADTFCNATETQVNTYNKDKHVNQNKKATDAVGVHNASMPQKIDETLDILADKLKSEKIFPQAKGFVTTWKNKGKNREAILHALNAVYMKKKFKAGPWAYARKVLDVENGNYNEAVSLLEHENIKTEGVDPKIMVLADKVAKRVDEREDRIRGLRKQAKIIQKGE